MIFNGFLPKFEYLQDITETTLFQIYLEVLIHDTEKYFPDDMNAENREQYYRLKFRAAKTSKPIVKESKDFNINLAAILDL